MPLLTLGLALWIWAHAFKRLHPARRANMGDKGKGLMALIIVAGVVLMVLGYRSAPFIFVYEPPTWGQHLNNLLMVFVFYLFASSGAKTRITRVIRHPQLTAFGLWAVAHLLANGDLASVILFGVLLIWAVVTRRVLAGQDWTPPEPATPAKEARTAIIALVVFGVVAMIHGWLGPSPFPG